MSVNRYTRLNWQNPISIFTPRPFQELAMVGDATQKKFDKKLADLDSTTDPFAKLNLQGSVKVYDPSTPGGIRDYDLGSSLEGQKAEVLNHLNQERESIVNDYMKDQDTNKFNQRSRQYVSKASNAYNQLASVANNMDTIRKHNEEVSKNKDFGTNPYYGQQLLDYNTKFIKSGGSDHYNPYSIADKFDQAKSINEHSSHFEESGLGSAYTTPDGYIKDVQTNGVTGSRVYQYASGIWDNSTDKQYADLKVKHQLAVNGYNGDEPMEYTDYQRSQDKNGNIIEIPIKVKGTAYDAMMKDEFNRFHDDIANKVVHNKRVEHLKNDSQYNLKLKDQIDNPAPQATTTETGAYTSNIVPDNLKGLIDKEGNITPESVKAGLERSVHRQFIVVDGKQINMDNLPKGYKSVISGKEAKETIVSPDGKSYSVYSETDPNKISKNITELGTFAATALKRFGLERSGDPYKDVNTALQFMKEQEVQIGKGTSFVNYPKLRDNITKSQRGSDKESSMFTNMEAANIDGTGKVDAQAFMKKNGIQPGSVEFSDYDFTAPGKKKWIGLNDKGEQVSFTMTSKDLNERNHFKAASAIEKDVTNYLTNKEKDENGKPVKYELTVVKGDKGEDMPVYKIGDTYIDYDGSKIQTYYKPKVQNENGEIKPEFVVVKTDRYGNYKEQSLSTYKEQVTDSWINSKYGVGLLKGISPKHGDIETEETNDNQ